ncbi:MAG: DUF58 domain-containing protein [Ruminococcus sp.]|nr:DUF58 domain-containing protein [Ruminococcus sp.]
MKNIISFVMCALLAAFMVYEISGTGGIFILVLLAVALVDSVFMLIMTYKGLELGLSLSAGIVSKGEDFEAQLELSKRTFLPSCFVEMTVGFTPNVGSRRENLTYKVITARLRGETIYVPLKAELCGMGKVFIEKVVLSDYLGLVTKRFKKLPEGCEIRIIPLIPDAGSQTEVLRSTSDKLAFDDSDEESDETSQVLTGVPGYEHRQYMPGDPLKRINWKLSSKRDDLMVRLDEKVTSASQVFRLDCPEPEENSREYYENMDLMIESSLSLMSMLVRAGFESEFNCLMDGVWETVPVKDEKDLLFLQNRLAGIEPYPDESRMPDRDINKKGKAMMCLTCCTSGMQAAMEQLLEGLTGSLVVCESSHFDKLTNDMWTVNKDHEFSRAV